MLYACNLESENKSRKGTSSLKINDSKLIVNNMQGQVLVYELSNLSMEPLEFSGHKSSFFSKASLYNDIIACGS